jgi:uncharacterized protein (DUF433 family)
MGLNERNRMNAATNILDRITINPAIFGGKPIVRGRRLAVEHVLGMLAAGDSAETILKGYSWLEPADILACFEYARRLVAHERVEPMDFQDLTDLRKARADDDGSPGVPLDDVLKRYGITDQ